MMGRQIKALKNIRGFLRQIKQFYITLSSQTPEIGKTRDIETT